MLKYRAITHLDSSQSGDKLTPGSGGPWVYLVEDRKSNQQFVMRKMEVGDNRVSDIARTQFDDVISITRDIPRVAKYVESFASWSKLDAALFLCLVGEHFPGGSVRGLLRERRERELVIGEGEVRRWYAQMLEGLEGVHREGSVHRRVKSSNVFVRDGGLVLGCMGLQTEEGDIKKNSKSILPPEYRRSDSTALTEKFDVWCLGLVLLEICSSSLLPWRDVVVALDTRDEEELEMELRKLIGRIGEKFSAEVVNVISCCLQTNPSSRHSTLDFCALSFTQDCLSLINSPLLTRIRSQETDNLPIPPSTPCPIMHIIDYMRDNVIIRQCQLIGLELMLECVSKHRDRLTNSDKRFVREVLQEYWESLMFRSAVVKLFVFAVRDCEDDPMEILLTQPYVDLVAKILISQTDPTELFSVSCIFLLLVSNHEHNSSIIANHGVLQHILSAVHLAHLSPDNSCLPHVCTLLWSLSVLPDNLSAITELNGLEWTITITKLHTSDASILLPAMNLLWSLFQDQLNIERAYYHGTVDICINSLNMHSSNANLSVAILNVLSVVCKIASCAYELLSDDSSGLITLLDFIKNSYSHEGSNGAIVTLLSVLFEFRDLKEELISLDVRDVLVERSAEVQHTCISEFIDRLSQM